MPSENATGTTGETTGEHTVEKTIAELAAVVGGRLTRGDGAAKVRRVLPTGDAAEDAVTFVTKPKYLPKLVNTRAAAVMISPELLARDDAVLPSGIAVIEVEHPYVAFAIAAQAFAANVPGPVGIHGSSVIDGTAKIGRRVSMGPFVFVGPNVTIGDGAVLHAGVHVEADSTVGAGTILYNHVVIRHGCKIGERCILHPGAVIGSDGFGFAQGHPSLVNVKIPQLGNVEIEDEVEVGSNACVDRGALGTTRIGRGTKLDNLVQVGHNVEIGQGCILVAQSGVAGSSRLGSSVVLGAQSGVSGHIHVGSGAVVGGQAGVMGSVPEGQRLLGSPAQPVTESLRNVVRIGKLDSLFSRVKKLEHLLDGSGDA